MAFALAGIGVFLCFFGGKWFKPSLQLSALVAGALLGVFSIDFFHVDAPPVKWAIIVGGAFAGVAIVTFVVNFGVFLLGALVGGIAFYFARDVVLLWSDLAWWGVIVGGIVGGVISSLLKRRILMLLTAVGGGYVFAEAVMRITGGQFWEWGKLPARATPLFKNVLWFIITAVGITRQVLAKAREKQK